MWLINVNTLELEEFQVCPTNEYAILSHRWASEELNFDQFRSGGGRGRKGFWKISRACEQARVRGLHYAWIDTCCIDKRSSAELSEAINSMYDWYAQAAECYVYMSGVVIEQSNADAHNGNTQEGYISDLANSTPTLSSATAEGREAFRRSQWFRRGWTLQELIAPRKVWFFGTKWKYLASRASNADDVANACSVHKTLLTNEAKIEDFSVAQRMSWAADRVTTRLEDRAYSLLGLFNVNMPLLYGEGNRAFMRLQEEILRQSDDESIFAWSGVDELGSGLLADKLRCFKSCGQVRRMKVQEGRSAYSMTNRGLSIQLQLIPCRMNTYLVPLRCLVPMLSHEQRQVYILISRTAADDQYTRVTLQGKAILTDRLLLDEDLLLVSGGGNPIGTYTFNGPLLAAWDGLPLNLEARKQTTIYAPQITQPSYVHRGRLALTGKASREFECWRNGSLEMNGIPLAGRKYTAVPDAQLQYGLTIKVPDFVAQIEPTSGGKRCWRIVGLKIGFDVLFEPVCLILAYSGKNAMSSWYRVSLWTPPCFPEQNTIVDVLDNRYWCVRGNRLRGLTFRLTTPSDEGPARSLAVAFYPCHVSKLSRPSGAEVFWQLELHIGKRNEESFFTAEDTYHLRRTAPEFCVLPEKGTGEPWNILEQRDFISD